MADKFALSAVFIGNIYRLMVGKLVLTKKFDDLVEQLKILPGVGAKTAQRMALNLLTYKRPQGQKLAETLKIAMTQIKQCQHCRSLSDDDICAICQDNHRHQQILCVVETVADLVAIEQTGSFQGRYFVLGGHLSPIDGIGAEQLGIQQLLHQLQSQQQQGHPIIELILATSTTIEGQTTAHFIHQIVKPYVTNVTRIAQGIPMGGELEYLDAMTLGQALQNRGVI